MGFALYTEKQLGGPIPHKVYYELYVAFQATLMWSDRRDFHEQQVRLSRRLNITFPLQRGYRRDVDQPIKSL